MMAKARQSRLQLREKWKVKVLKYGSPRLHHQYAIFTPDGYFFDHAFSPASALNKISNHLHDQASLK